MLEVERVVSEMKNEEIQSGKESVGLKIDQYKLVKVKYKQGKN